MHAVLTDTFGQPANGKLDLNNASQGELSWSSAGCAGAGQCGVERGAVANFLVRNILAEINTQHSGLITDFKEIVGRAGNEPRCHERAAAGVLPVAVPWGFGADGGPLGGRQVAAEGSTRDALRAGRHAGLYRLPLRMDLWFGRCDCVLPRYAHHHRVVLSLSMKRSHDDRDCRAFDFGRLLNERYDRHL